MQQSNKSQAICAAILTIPLTLYAVARHHPQIAIKSHYALALTTMCAMGYHLWKQQSVCQWYMMGAVALWLVLSITAGFIAIFNKRCWGRASSSVIPCVFQELLQLNIAVPGSWSIQPGQYVRIWMPHMGLRAFLQLPLFYVAFWEDRNEHEGKDKQKHENMQRILYVLTRPRPSGLTMQLYGNTLAHRKPRWAVILGPYGRSNDFSEFGTIIFIVEDIGIVRVLPFIRMLVVASQQRQAMVRKLEVVWQMDDISTYFPTQDPELPSSEAP